jgi:hypothetical protein
VALSYKNLYQFVTEEINKRTSTATAGSSLDRSNTHSAINETGGSDVTALELVSAVQSLMSETMTPVILEGLEVEATEPISDRVIIRAGRGAVGGKLFTLDEDITVQVPMNGTTMLFFVNLYRDSILVEPSFNEEKLTLAKVVLPNLDAQFIQDDKDNGGNAYIVNFREYKIYGHKDIFEEDTLELFRNNMGAVLAENLIGNIRLSENLRITNTSGTLQLNSDSILMNDFDGNNLVTLNPRGIYFNRADGVELAKFTTEGARIGNLVVNPNSILSGNFAAGVSGFCIYDTGNAEFNDIVVRGTVFANQGQVGGFTIANNQLYATTTGTIKTSATAGAGSNGVVMDKDGIRVYDAVLGLVANFPSDGSKPTISAGTIGGINFEVTTNTVIRTSQTVGDGSADSSGLLMNNTGFYGCTANQLLSDANFKILANGNAYFKGEIQATAGTIGGITISGSSLSGGIISGTELMAPIIETSPTMPRVRIDANGIYYQVTGSTGKYAEFMYGDGSKYGTGVSAYLFNTNYPILAITAEQSHADIRLFDRAANPTTGRHELGDLICVNGLIKRCSAAGNPGTFVNVGETDFLALLDTPDTYTGHALQYVRVKSDLSGLEFQTPAGAGDMAQAQYDSNADNIVNSADVAGVTAKTVIQNSHGFSAGHVLYLNGGTYALAKADVSSTAEVVGIVRTVVDGNTFILATNGYVSCFSGLTAGKLYFLSDTTAGALMDAETFVEGHISKPIFIATGLTTGYFFNMRGVEINVNNSNVSAYYQDFTSSSFVSSVLTLTHNFGHGHPVVQIYDNSGVQQSPTITRVDGNSLTVDFTGWTVTGTWYAVVLDIGGLAIKALTDKDGDTGVWVEQTPDEDKIHFKVAGVDKAVIDSNGFSGSVPVGGIIMWSGSIATIPTNWALCDGNNSTPDLRDKFIVGAKQDDAGVSKTNITGSLTKNGGAATNTHTHAAGSFNLPQIAYCDNDSTSCQPYYINLAHNGVLLNRPIRPFNISGTSASASDTNILPTYYALAFIMRTA